MVVAMDQAGTIDMFVLRASPRAYLKMGKTAANWFF
jgi:hypothetical protein